MHRSVRPAFVVASVAVLLSWLAPVAAHAQDSGEGAEITGVIVDRQTGDPVPGAVIRVVPLVGDGDAWMGESGPDGSFRTPRIPLGAYILEIDGPPLLPVSEPIALSAPGVSDVRVEMVAVDYQLDPVVAVGTRLDRLARGGFYDRIAQGSGYFITRDDIVASRARETTDLLRSVPGILVSGYDGSGFDTRVYFRRAPTSIGTGGTSSVGQPRFSIDGSGRASAVSDSISTPGGCTPLWVLDGAITEMSPPIGVNQVVNPSTLEGIEVYEGARAPLQYLGLSDCGVIMLWTRTAGGASGSGRLLPSWQQAAVGLGITIFAIFSTR